MSIKTMIDTLKQERDHMADEYESITNDGSLTNAQMNELRDAVLDIIQSIDDDITFLEEELA